jgi:FtsZ-interacting cell division protein YlmF
MSDLIDINTTTERTTVPYSVYDIVRSLKIALSNNGFFSYDPPAEFKGYTLPKPDRTVYIIKEIGNDVLFETKKEAEEVINAFVKAKTYKKINSHDAPSNLSFTENNKDNYSIGEFSIYSDEGLEFWRKENKKANALWETYYKAVHKFNDDFKVMKGIVVSEMERIATSIAIQDTSPSDFEDARVIVEYILWPEVLGLHFHYLMHSDAKWEKAIAFLFEREPIIEQDDD